MDQDQIPAILEELKRVEAFESDPTWLDLAEQLQSEQSATIDAILNFEVRDLATFLTREQLIGEVRGLRRAPGLLKERVEATRDKVEGENQQ